MKLAGAIRVRTECFIKTGLILAITLLPRTGEARICSSELANLGSVLVRQQIVWWKLSDHPSMARIPLAVDLSIGQMIRSNKAARKLGSILVKHAKEKNGFSGDMKEEINNWRKKHQIKMKFLYLNQLDEEIPKLQRQGLLTSSENHLFDYGYLSDKAWNLLVSQGKLPAIDPHDILTHALSFTLPGFTKALKTRARVMVKWLEHLNQTNTPSIRSYTKEASSPQDEAALYALNWLIAVRNSSHENLTFLSGNGGQTRMVVHGNFAFRYAAPFYERDRDLIEELVDLFLGGEATVSFQALPRIKEYLQERGSSAQPFLELLKTLGLEYSSRREIKEKLRGILAKCKIEISGEAPEVRGIRIMNSVARAAGKNKRLRMFFNAGNRIRLLGEAPRFIDEYLEWFNK